jgi:hypothetical protein
MWTTSAKMKKFIWTGLRPILNIRKLSDLTREVLFNIMQETGDIDKAAAVFYHRAITEPTNRKFIEFIYTKQNEFMRKASRLFF